MDSHGTKHYLYCGQLILALMLIGCGKPPATVEAEFAPYLAEFAQQIGISTSNVDTLFADLSKPTAGVCEIYTDGKRIIRIDRAYWVKASNDEKEQTLFHELGHCVLGMDHIEALNEYKCPVSIMYPYVFGSSPCYAANKPYYFQELASHGR